MTKSRKHLTPEVYKRLMSYCSEDGGCLLWTGLMGGSGTLAPATSVGHRRHQVRRLMWEKKTGHAVPAGKCVTVDCGQARCVAPDHLILTTRAESGKRAGAQGKFSTLTRRSRVAAAKQAQSPLTAEQVREIRAGDGPLKEAAARFGVSIAAISKIRRGERWKDYASPFGALMPVATTGHQRRTGYQEEALCSGNSSSP